MGIRILKLLKYFSFRGSGNSFDLVDMETFLSGEDHLAVAGVQNLLVMPGQESPAGGLNSTEEIFFDYPDIKVEELDQDTISEDLEVSQFSEVYYDPSLGTEIELGVNDEI